MIHVALLEPEIAGNVGNAARTCMATGASLHLVRPLGFRLNDAALRRAGMDYWREADVTVHDGFADFREKFSEAFAGGRVVAFTTKTNRGHADLRYQTGDVLLFGPESRGLPEEVRRLTTQVRLPMRDGARSLNLAVSVGVAVYECWRQLGYAGAVNRGPGVGGQGPVKPT